MEQDKTSSTPRVFYDPRANYCERCGSPMHHRFVAEEGRERDVCRACGFIRYFNPTPIVITIIEHQGKILLARRAIEPRKGYWTLPGGFQELHETLAEGAKRESWEEAGADIEVTQLYTVFDIPFAGQTTFAFLSRLKDERVAPGPESLEVGLFSEDEIPWNDLSFRTVSLCLRHYFADRSSGRFPLHSILIDRPDGA